MGGRPVNSQVVIFTVTVLVIPLLLAEFGDWCPWMAARIVRWAARRLGDPVSCQRYEEEWIANLNEVPGKLTRLLAAFGYLAYMPGMRRSIRSRLARRPVSPPPDSLLPQPVFAGRIKEVNSVLTYLRAALDETQRRPVLVAGPPGVGKTSLANFCARQLQDDFPDGRLFLSASGMRSAGDCLGQLLTAVGVPRSQLPPSEAGMSALFRERVAGRRVLVVLDDMEPDQLPALLRDQPPCPVLITWNTWQLPDDLITPHLVLRGLAHDEACEMLRGLLGRRIDAEPEAAEKLVEIFAGFPLALCLAVSYCETDPSATITSLLGRLCDDLADVPCDGNVRAVFDTLHQSLPAEARALLRRLSLLPEAPFGKYEAALLMSASPDHSAHLLQVLAENHLVRPANGTGSYILHDLVRAYATELLLHDDEEQAQGLRDILKHHGIDPTSG
jgi:DNA polymerase III delta prime subunit